MKIEFIAEKNIEFNKLVKKYIIDNDNTYLEVFRIFLKENPQYYDPLLELTKKYMTEWNDDERLIRCGEVLGLPLDLFAEDDEDDGFDEFPQHPLWSLPYTSDEEDDEDDDSFAGFDVDVVVDCDDDRLSVSDVFGVVRFVKEQVYEAIDEYEVDEYSDLAKPIRVGFPEVCKSVEELKDEIGDCTFAGINKIFVRVVFYDVFCDDEERHNVTAGFVYYDKGAERIAANRYNYDF